ncbi:MAG: prolyl oligopeptidase family serine peptidase [Chitinivibrionales bacterium]|nr:prolyl oligopeptidase family serine peptidase [Chitinivibrionales bacterium]
MQLSKTKAWKSTVPRIREVTITASSDKSAQPALFYNSGTARRKPLLLVLHSWSADYRQHFSIPYAVWAAKNDWVFIHPDYRGAFTNPQATASENAVKDVLDAVAYARKHARIDQSRIYIAGFSGGAMMTLIMVGRFPEIWAGALAWVPVYDLVDWYRETKGSRHDYSGHIERSCGGVPREGTQAGKECRKRSPSMYLADARGKRVKVYIATGIQDNFVCPSHSLRAFNDLAAPADRISKENIEYIDKRHRLPPQFSGTFVDSLYADAGIELLWEKTSANVTLKIYEGKHDVIYNAGLLWLSGRRR